MGRITEGEPWLWPPHPPLAGRPCCASVAGWPEAAVRPRLSQPRAGRRRQEAGVRTTEQSSSSSPRPGAAAGGPQAAPHPQPHRAHLEPDPWSGATATRGQRLAAGPEGQPPGSVRVNLRPEPSVNPGKRGVQMSQAAGGRPF